MTPLDMALRYADCGWPVFPCQWQKGPTRKHPLTPNGFHDAVTDPERINILWQTWPDALIGVPTGRRSQLAILDVDVKKPDANGYDTLDALGYGVLPNTPLAHTSTGGLHIYFAPPATEIRNTAGQRGRGIGPGLDWRGEGGYIIVPSPGSGYRWDPHWNFGSCRLAEIPPGLMPREHRQPTPMRQPAAPASGLSKYAEAALDSACQAIISAPDGEQEATLNSECYSLGTLAGAGGIPRDFAQDALIWAARQMPSYSPAIRGNHGSSKRKSGARLARACSTRARSPHERLG